MSCHNTNIAMRRLAAMMNIEQLMPMLSVSNHRYLRNLLHWKMLSIQLLLGLPLILLHPSVNPVIAAFSIESFGCRRIWLTKTLYHACLYMTTWCRSTGVVPASCYTVVVVSLRVQGTLNIFLIHLFSKACILFLLCFVVFY